MPVIYNHPMGRGSFVARVDRRIRFRGSVALILVLLLLSASLHTRNAVAQDLIGTTDGEEADAEANDRAAKRLDPTAVYRRLLDSTAWLRFTVEGEGVHEGTGWVVDAEKGLLVTNQHVVDGVDEIDVYFPVKKDGKVVLEQDHYLENVDPVIGHVVDRSTEVDLALVKVDALPDGIIALPLAAASPEPGQRVFTLGSQPAGSEGMWIFTTGEVRQVYRRSHALGHVAQIVETQLPTNCGNSGGAVVNDRAEVVAVVEGHSSIARLVSLFVDISELRKYLDATLPLADPKTPEAFNTRGTRRHDEGRYDGAIADYTASLRLDPDQPVTLANRGWAFYAKDDYDAAVGDFSEAIEKDPQFASAYEGRGTTYREMGEYKKAIKDLSDAIRRDSTVASAYQRRATAFESTGRLEKALADRNRAVELSPEDFTFLYQRGQTLRKLQRYDEAIADFEKAAALEPGDAAVWYEIGYVYQDRKQYPQAVVFYDFAIKRDDNIPSFYNNRGLCKVEMEEYLGAARDFMKAIELRPDHSPYHRRLGIVFQEAGQHEVALKHFNKAIELDSEDPENFNWRADCHEALGDQQAADADRAKMKTLSDK